MKANKDDIKAVVKMKDIMGLYGLQAHKGKAYLCPFHTEKTPSLRIKEDSFMCFGCNTSGDIFAFTQLMNGCDFPAALDFICSRFGIQNDGKFDPTFEKMLQERQKAAQERERELAQQRYVYGRLCAYKRHLEALDGAVMVDNHIAWCERILDRMQSGEKLFADVEIDDRLSGLWQQIKR